eukprot:1849231-Pleurochrysis_carterae.AAC.1
MEQRTFCLTKAFCFLQTQGGGGVAVFGAADYLSSVVITTSTITGCTSGYADSYSDIQVLNLCSAVLCPLWAPPSLFRQQLRTC